MARISNKQDTLQGFFSSNRERCKMNKIDWCDGGLQLADIATKNVGEHDLTPIMKYIIVRLYN